MSHTPRVERIYPLTPMQEGMLVDSLLRGDSALYLEQVVFQATGTIDPVLFEQSLQELGRRHAVLRTAFVHEKLARPRQVVLSEAPIPLRFEDMRARELAEGIDVTAAPLFRASLRRMAGDRHEIGFSFHHIILDGWSLGLLLEDLLRIYRALRDTTPIPPVSAVPYERFVQWIESRHKDASLSFWATRLRGYEQPVGLPRLRPSTGAYRLEEHVIELDDALTAQLQKLAGARQATLSSAVRAIWSVLLGRYNDATDVVFGAVVSGRPADLDGADRMVGLCINTIPVRVAIDERRSFGDLLRDVQRAALDAQDHEYLPLSDVQGRTPLRADLFDHVLVYENYPRGGLTEESRRDLGMGFQIESLQGREQTSYDFNLIVGVERRLVARFNYNASAYDAWFIEQIARHFVHLVAQVVANPDVLLGELDIMPSAERDRVVVEFNAQGSDYPRDATIHALFEEQVALGPDRIALVSPRGSFSYAELDRRANALAVRLKSHDIQPGRIVAVIAGRDEQAIIGILAVLKAGGAYLPIDPSTPPDRVQFMLRDAGVAVVLEKSESDLELTVLSDADHKTVDSRSGPDSLAYVMYTSGSSGTPKGVMVEHRGVARLVRNTNFISFGEHDRVLLTSAPTFDVSVFEQWGALLNGGALHVAGDDILFSAEALGRYLAEHQITVLWLISPLFNELADQDPTIFAPVRWLLVGGDVVSAAHAAKVRAACPDLIFVNGYGPTENTTFSACHVLENETGPEIPIGRPISNSTAYVLDRRDRPVPAGVAGELCVGGDGVARGYLNRPDLTAERFFADPFQPGGRMYRTGDLARWRPEGTLSFLGRNDQQVKIRGFRIELGEIEQCLASRPDVKDAVVIARPSPSGHKELVAYVRPRPGAAAPDAAALRTTLLASLPDYMVPAYFVPVDRWPLTSSGKVDRKALPDPRGDGTASYIAPRTDTERALADLWQEVLGAARVGVDDNFFEIGGDSIKALQIASRLRQRGLVLRMHDLFTHRTLGALAPHVSPVGGAAVDSAAQDAPLTPIQSWFFETSRGVSHHFNQALVLEANARLDETAFRSAVASVAAHHDALRTTFERRGDDIIQRAGQPRVDVEVVDLRGHVNPEARAADIAGAAQGSLDPSKGILIKVVLFHLDAGDHVLMTIHHLAIDVVSWHILIEDLGRAYDALKDGRPVSLPPKTHSAQTWARALREYASSDGAIAELGYWQGVASAAVDPLPSTVARMSDRESRLFMLGIDESRALLQKANHAYGTRAEDLLLAALLSALDTQLGVRRARVFLEGHGREELIDGIDISRTVGWFTSLYPVLFESADDRSWRRQIPLVKETLRRVPHRGIGYGILRYAGGHRALDVPSSVCFNFIGTTDAPAGAFRLSSLDPGLTAAGTMPLPHPLDITARVAGGRIEIVVAYARSIYDERTIDGLGRGYLEAASAIAAHCTAQSSRVLTPSDLGDASMTIEELDALPIAVDQIQAIHPLTPIQTGIVFHALRDPASTAYLEQSVIALEGDVDPAALEAAFNAVLAKWDLLRSVVVHHALRQPRQLVMRAMHLTLGVRRLVDEEPDARDRIVSEFVVEDRRKPFDLAQGPLMRAALFQTDPRKWTLVWTFHHVLMDGWSVGLVIRDVLHAYASLRHGRPWSAGPTPRYAAYLEWLESHGGARADQFWRHTLDGYDQPAGVPRVAPIEQSDLYDLAEHTFSLDADDSERIRALARAQQVTVNTVFQTLWGLLLQSYNDTDDVVFGAVVSGRAAPVDGLKDMVGLFINTVPVRVQVTDAMTLGPLLRQVQTSAVSAQEHEHIALADIQRQSALGNRLLDHIVIFENYPIDEALRAAASDELGFRIVEARTFEQTNYDFNVTIVPESDFRIRFTFNGRTYPLDFVRTVGRHFQALLRAAGETPEAPARLVKDVSAVLAHDVGARPAAADSAGHTTVVDLFEAHVRHSPDRPAIVRGTETLTYRETDEQAARIAAACRIAPGELIGVLCKRPDRAMLGMLAALKAGGAFLPLDPAWPAARLDQIVADSGCRVIDERDIDAAIAEAGTSPVEPHRPAPSDLAYVIYTSGSTGRPKGVMIEHGSFFSYIEWAARQYVGGDAVNFPLFTSLAFDLTLTSVFVPLTSGNAVVVYEGDAHAALENILNEGRVSAVKLTPAHLRLIRSRDNRGSSIRRFIVGGENLESTLCREIAASFANGSIDIFNEYGPTETTVGCMIHRFDAAADARDAVPIGAAIDRARVLLLDRHDREAPIGGIGEICVAGAGVARGYLGRPDLTIEKFVPVPDRAGGRMYRTGDIGRRLADGRLEFVGRRDGQVKVRGHRVELGEIELQLLAHDDVAHACVTARRVRHDHLELVAYAVMKPGAAPFGIKEVREHLAPVLPEALIPSYLAVLDALPLTPHGKIDRAALPDPTVSIEQVQPDTPIERMLCRVWCDVLGLSGVGVENNFFEVGGDSIKAIQISAELQKLNYHVTLADVLSHPTIRALADRLVPDSSSRALAIDIGAGPLSPIQRWFFALGSPTPNHYNQAIMLHAEIGLDRGAVQLALDALVEHHHALRTVYEDATQRVEPAQVVPLWLRVLTDEHDAASAIAATAAEAHASLNIASGPVFTAAMFDTASGSHLLLVAHHLAVDGVSWRVLIDDFASAYRQALDGNDIVLPPQSQSYLSWVQRLEAHAGDATSQSEIGYWQDVESRAAANHLIAADLAPPQRRVDKIRQLHARLDDASTQSLLRDAHRRYGTEINDLLLSGLQLALQDVFGVARAGVLGVLLEGHGREEFAAGIDVRRTVGWFTSLFPIVLDGGTTDLETVISATRDMLRRIPRRGIGYSVLKYMTPALSPAVWPQVRFNYLGQVDDSLAGGLLRLSPHDAGPAVSGDTPTEQILDVQGIARGGHLLLSFTYHPEVISESQAIKLSESYCTYLRRIAAHCTEPASASKAPDIDKIRALLKRR